LKTAALVALALVVTTPSMMGKPPGAPVEVEYSRPPAGLKAGDEVTTTIAFRASADLRRLDVSIAPFMGVEIVSGPRRATFVDVKRGDAPEIRVRVRLTSSKIASLGVRFTTLSDGKQGSDAMTIEYGPE
jgi:hypothetical protein